MTCINLYVFEDWVADSKMYWMCLRPLWYENLNTGPEHSAHLKPRSQGSWDSQKWIQIENTISPNSVGICHQGNQMIFFSEFQMHKGVCVLVSLCCEGFQPKPTASVITAYWQHTALKFWKLHIQHIYSYTPPQTAKDLFSARIKGSGLGRHFWCGNTEVKENSLCSTKFHPPHLFLFHLCCRCWL